MAPPYLPTPTALVQALCNRMLLGGRQARVASRELRALMDLAQLAASGELLHLSPRDLAARWGASLNWIRGGGRSKEGVVHRWIRAQEQNGWGRLAATQADRWRARVPGWIWRCIRRAAEAVAPTRGSDGDRSGIDRGSGGDHPDPAQNDPTPTPDPTPRGSPRGSGGDQVGDHRNVVISAGSGEAGIDRGSDGDRAGIASGSPRAAHLDDTPANTLDPVPPGGMGIACEGARSDREREGEGDPNPQIQTDVQDHPSPLPPARDEFQQRDDLQPAARVDGWEGRSSGSSRLSRPDDALNAPSRSDAWGVLWGLEDSPLRILPRSQLHRMRMAWEAEAVQLEYLLKLPAEKLQWVPGVGSARAPIVYEALYFHRIDEEFQKELARRAAPAPHVSESQGETH